LAPRFHPTHSWVGTTGDQAIHAGKHPRLVGPPWASRAERQQFGGFSDVLLPAGCASRMHVARPDPIFSDRGSSRADWFQQRNRNPEEDFLH